MPGQLGRVSRGIGGDVYGGIAESERLDMAVELPGEIVSFDTKTQTATIKVLYKPKFNGQEIDFPDLLEVPVAQPRGGGFAITKPIAKGDQGMIRFASRDLDGWQNEDGAQPSGTARMNSFSDGVFHPGLHSGKRALANYDAENAFFGTEDHANGYRVSPDGTLAIEGKGESLLQIVSDLIKTLLESDDVEGPGFTPGVRDELNEILQRNEKMKLR